MVRARPINRPDDRDRRGPDQGVEPTNSVTIPEGATVLDLSRSVVLPGLIDAHTHLGSRADRYDEVAKFKDTPNNSAFAAVLNARKTLEAGFTTVRDLGSKPFLAVDLRDAINEGFLVGPPDRRERAGDLDDRWAR